MKTVTITIGDKTIKKFYPSYDHTKTVATVRHFYKNVLPIVSKKIQPLGGTISVENDGKIYFRVVMSKELESNFRGMIITTLCYYYEKQKRLQPK